MPKSKHRRKSKAKAAPGAGAEAASMAGEAAAATISGDANEPKAKHKGVGPVQFFSQVRDEARKVTWTSRNETMVSTIMVLIMVAVASLFFLAVDQVLRLVVPLILSIGA